MVQSPYLVFNAVLYHFLKLQYLEKKKKNASHAWKLHYQSNCFQKVSIILPKMKVLISFPIIICEHTVIIIMIMNFTDMYDPDLH